MDSNTHLNSIGIAEVDIEKSDKYGEATVHNRVTMKPLMRQMFAASGSILLSVGTGMTMGFSGTAIPQLNSTFALDDEKISWIASTVTLPMPIGGMLSGVLMESYGRRRTQMFYCLPWIIGWITMVLASNISQLYIGRIITGVCVGLVNPSSTIYIAEISDPHNRGFILSFISLGISVGVLISHILGTYFEWKNLSWISSIFPFISFILLYFSPESPTWLVRKGYMPEAEKSFYRLTVGTEKSRNELINLRKKNGQQNSETRYKFNKLFLSYLFFKPFVITSVFFITQQFSGVNVIVFYTVNILQNFSNPYDFNKYTYMFIIDAIRVIMSIIACMLLNKYRRRTLFLTSAFGSILFLTSLSIYLRFPPNTLGSFGSLIPVVCIMMYIIFSSIGLVPLPWIMSSEIYPVIVRDFGNGISNCFAFIIMFVAVKTAPILFSILGMSGTFGLYSAITFTGTVLLYFSLPETRNKSLQEVEENLRNGKNNHV